MKKYRMDAMALITEVEALIKRNFGITESELKETYRAPVHSTAKAEAL
jgi:transketolase